MSNPFIQTTPPQLKQMLEAVGAASVDEIFGDQIPEEYQFRGSFDLPPALSELDIQREIGALAAKDSSTQQMVSFLGGGIYEHFIPAAVGHLAGRSEFVTSYTPYQPEASQGTLQAFFEFQTLVARLFAMDVANASLYDGASALGEALFLALSAKSGRSTLLLPDTLHPDFRAVADTYLRHFGVKMETIPSANGAMDLGRLRELCDAQCAAVVVQQPNYLGCLEEVHEISRIAHEAGALLVAVCDPVSLGLLEPPGAYGADIAVGEGQGLGLRQWLGGETLGLFTCKREFLRRVPGRLVGMARDKADKRGFVLTLQTREQHIRREKATSNICTNHAHNALRATIHLCLMGPQGMARVARACARNLQRLRSAVARRAPQAFAFSAPCFQETVLRLNRPARLACQELLEQGFFAGVPLEHLGKQYENLLLVCTSECRTDAEIDRYAQALEAYL